MNNLYEYLISFNDYECGYGVTLLHKDKKTDNDLKNDFDLTIKKYIHLHPYSCEQIIISKMCEDLGYIEKTFNYTGTFSVHINKDYHDLYKSAVEVYKKRRERKYKINKLLNDLDDINR